MTSADLLYIKRLIQERIITGPVLELGAGYGGVTCKELVDAEGLTYHATDIVPCRGVDYVANFECEDVLRCFPRNIGFGSILILNVLEHTFNPIQILDNARKLLRPDGVLIIITPCVWPIHNYPLDCYRLLPNFYERYAESRQMHLDRQRFEYLGFGRVASNLEEAGTYRFPPPAQGIRYWKSRVIHRVFNTFGRGMSAPSHVAIGAILHMTDTQAGKCFREGTGQLCQADTETAS